MSSTPKAAATAAEPGWRASSPRSLGIGARAGCRSRSSATRREAPLFVQRHTVAIAAPFVDTRFRSKDGSAGRPRLPIARPGVRGAPHEQWMIETGQLLDFGRLRVAAARSSRAPAKRSASPSRGPGNGILWAETGGRFQPQNAGERPEFGSQRKNACVLSPFEEALITIWQRRTRGSGLSSWSGKRNFAG